MAVRKYRVREGFTYGALTQHSPGTILDLDEETAKHSMDKLELAEIVQNVPVEPPGESLEDSPPEGHSDGGADVPWPQEEDAEEEVAPAPRSKSAKRKSGD